jgi:hypothetical protein
LTTTTTARGDDEGQGGAVGDVDEGRREQRDGDGEDHHVGVVESTQHPQEEGGAAATAPHEAAQQAVVEGHEAREPGEGLGRLDVQHRLGVGAHFQTSTSMPA